MRPAAGRRLTGVRPHSGRRGASGSLLGPLSSGLGPRHPAWVRPPRLGPATPPGLCDSSTSTRSLLSSPLNNCSGHLCVSGWDSSAPARWRGALEAISPHALFCHQHGPAGGREELSRLLCNRLPCACAARPKSWVCGEADRESFLNPKLTLGLGQGNALYFD